MRSLTTPTPSAVPSLDPIETSVHVHDPTAVPPPTTEDPASVAFRHSGWQPTRNRVYAALNATSAAHSRLDRFTNCGSHAWVYQANDNPDLFRVQADHCRDRWCLPCARSRAARLAARAHAHLTNRHVRLITLTLVATATPLTEQIDHLFGSFRRLRRHALWRSCVHGGLAVLEISRNGDTGAWHPHLHVLAVGRYLPHDELREAWRTATNGSYIVDIRAVPDNTEAIRYVLRYLTKPASTAIYRHHDSLCQLLLALHHRRTYQTFGILHGLDADTSDDADGWTPVAPLHHIIYQAALGEPSAVNILNHLRRTLTCLDLTFSPTSSP